MNDCIYSPYCTRKQCDLACTVRAESSYWLNRCQIPMYSSVFKSPIESIQLTRNIITKNIGKVNSVFVKNTVSASDLYCYCCICMYGQHKAFSNGIYNLNFSEYLEETKRSWKLAEEPESLEMMRIWTNSAYFLVISHLDYVQFGDFECQTLLRLIQDKEKQQTTTFIIVPKDDPLIGKGHFFPRLQQKLKEVRVK